MLRSDTMTLLNPTRILGTLRRQFIIEVSADTPARTITMILVTLQPS